MELELAYDLVIQCNECGLVHMIDKDSLDVDTYSYERNMDDEVEYDFVGNVVAKNAVIICNILSEHMNIRSE